jgi:cellulose biosynthesis protein BcsQ
MKTVALLSEKGGAGKTTVTVHLGVAAQRAGLDVAIIDLDPQASAAEWADQRGSAPEAVAIPPARLDKLLADLRTNETDLVLIDTPREANNAGYIAAQAADFIMIPFKRGGFDFRALKRTLDLHSDLTDAQLMRAATSAKRSMSAGSGARLGSCVWHIVGLQRSIREWAMRQGWSGRPVRVEQAQGILVAALGMLVGHYGYGKS